MKSRFPSFCAITAALGVACASSASAAVSETVGFVTTTIAGNTSENPSGAATLISPTLQPDDIFVGKPSSNPADSTTASFSTNVPTNLDDSYMLEITSGSYEGWWSAIDSSTSSTIVLTSAFPPDLAEIPTIAVRKFTTIDSFIGEEAAKLEDFDNVSQDYDTLQILDPMTQVVTSYVYLLASTGLVAEDGWYNFVTAEPANNVIIYPGTAVKIKRLKTTPVDLKLIGKVKTTKTIVEIAPRDNWIGQSLATGGTFGFMNFADQIVKIDTTYEGYDAVNVINPDQSITTYVSLDEASFGQNNMARFVDGADATNVEIKEATGLVIRRDPAESGSSITIPAQVITNN